MMTIKYLTLKPGSILLYKEYNFFNRLWAKIRRKELPYNKIMLFIDKCYYIGNPNMDGVILELKRDYNKREINKLHYLVNNESFEDFSSDTKELYSILNVIRPNTFKSDSVSLETLIENNRYYTVKNIRDAKEWSEFLY